MRKIGISGNEYDNIIQHFIDYRKLIVEYVEDSKEWTVVNVIVQKKFYTDNVADRMAFYEFMKNNKDKIIRVRGIK